MIKVSVIIPIYGVERYIERCATSLFEQTLDDIEFVFVNDCTNDNSIENLKKVIENYPQRKDYIQIINHNENLGLPTARRTGLGYVHGEYVAHCDSDDWVESNAYEILYNEAIKNEADLVWCDYYRSDGNNDTQVTTINQPKLMQGPIWNKLIKVSLYKEDITFPTANKGEDGALLTQLSYYSKKRIYIPQPLYHYFINPSSICGVISENACLKKVSQEIDNVLLRIRFLKKHGIYDDNIDSVLRWKMLCRRNLIPILGKRKYYKLWKSTFPEIDKYYLLSSGIDFRMKFAYILIRLRLDRVFNTIVHKWA